MAKKVKEEAANKTDKKKKRGAGRILSILLILIALGIMGYSGYRLYDIFSGYAKANNEYEELAEDFTRGGEEVNIEPQNWNSPEAVAAEEQAPPPIDVDWNSLRAINEDIVGWIYMEAQPTINYPICHGADNDFYLHHTFRKEYVFAGSIFMEAKNAGNFSDRNTILYGHNMKNQSMFGLLKFYKTEEKYKESPYFWILTPQGNYRYKIFAAFDTPMDSDVYTIFKSGGEDFDAWEKRVLSYSVIDTGVTPEPEDYVVTLSTCTSNSSVRCVVLGRCVSTDKPIPPEEVLLEDIVSYRDESGATSAAETAQAGAQESSGESAGESAEG